MATKRDIKYINRDFNSFKNQLSEFARTYFPNTYSDFSPSSPGMLFMEQASYIGDVLSFYLDNQIQETYIQYARETNSLFELAYMLGYKPKVTSAATTDLTIYQRIPASGNSPDFSYALTLQSNAVISSNVVTGLDFLTTDAVNFAESSSNNPTQVTIYEIDGGGNPISYLLQKEVKAISSTINTATLDFTTSVQFDTRTIQDDNIIGILDITDSDGNIWYEVDHLGQELIYDSIKNTNENDPNRFNDVDTPYILQTRQIERRFTSRFLNNNTLQLQFGAGNTGDVDEEVVPNPNNVGLGLPFEKDKLTTAFSPTNFIFTNTYGIAPSNTTLTVRYLTGGGVESNAEANTLTVLNDAQVTFNNVGLNPTTADTYRNTLEVTNLNAASGGSDGDSIEEVRQNTLGTFQNQLRTVTSDDYLIRTLSMPSKYGNLAKAYAEGEKLENLLPGEIPSNIALYILSEDLDGKLTTASNTLKENLRTYLTQYRIINDSVSIKDAYIINIGVNFEIVTLPNYNNNDVLSKCIQELITFFNISNWQINEPILLRDLYILLDKVEGVQTVKNIVIENKTGTLDGNLSFTYSDYSYDISGATVNNVVYPSLDPMIFEVKFPNTDIKGRVVPL